MAKPSPAGPVRGPPPMAGRLVRPPLGVVRPMDMSRPVSGARADPARRPPAPKRPSGSRSAEGLGRVCTVCGADRDDGENFCGGCGTPWLEENGSFEVPKKRRPSCSLPPTHVVPPGRRLDEWQAAVVPKSNWANADEASSCTACDCAFTEDDKHHCRKCGQVFCGACSKSRTVIPMLHSFNTQRLCNKCASDLLPHVDRPAFASGGMPRSASSLPSSQLEAALARVRGKSPSRLDNLCPSCHEPLTESDCACKRRGGGFLSLDTPRTPLGRSQSSMVIAPSAPSGPPALPPSASFHNFPKPTTPSSSTHTGRSQARSMSCGPPALPDKPPPVFDKQPDTPRRLHPSPLVRPMMPPSKSPLNGNKYLTSAEAVAKDSKVQRVADYFVMFGLGALRSKECLNAGTISELLFEACFSEGGRYPVLDWKECPLSPNAFMFAFPKGVRLYEGLVGHERDTFEDSYQARRPKVHQFVLTKLDGGKQYCSCLQFWDPWSKEEAKSLLRGSFSEAKTKDPSLASQLDACMARCFSHLELGDTLIYVPRAICLMSQQPQYTLFTEFLKTLYQIMKHPDNDKPCERYITNLIHEVDLPPEGVATEFTLGNKTIWFTRPGMDELPLADLDFKLLFRSLPPDLILMVYACLATEQKIVFCSTYTHVLVGVVECLCALLYPFEWQGVYMPLLPDKLGDFLYAPVPFIAGVHRSSIESGALDIPEELVFLDIDEADLRVPSVESLVYLPENISRKLRKIITLNADIFDPESPWLSLGQYAFMHGEDLDNIDLSSSPPEVSSPTLLFTPEQPVKVFSATPTMPGDPTPFNITKIRKAFFDIWLEFLAPYKNFIRTPSPGVDQRDDEFFDSAGFINDAPKANRPMIKGITDTQMFARLLNDWMAIAEKTADNETLQRVKFLDENIAAFKHRKSSKAKIEKALSDNNKDAGKHIQSSTRTKATSPSAHFFNLPSSLPKSARFPTSLNPIFYEKSVRTNAGIDSRSQSTQAIDLLLGRNTNDQITDLALGLSYDFEKVRRVTVAQRAAAASKPPTSSPSGIIVSFKKEPNEKKSTLPVPPPRRGSLTNEPPKNKSLVDRLAPSGGVYILTPEDLATAISESLSRRQQAGNFSKPPPKPANKLPQDRLTGQNELAAMFAKQASLRNVTTGTATPPVKPMPIVGTPKAARPPQPPDQELTSATQKRASHNSADSRPSFSLANMPPPGRPDRLSASSSTEDGDKRKESQDRDQERKDERERKDREDKEKHRKEREDKENEERERVRKEKEERDKKREREEREEREKKERERRAREEQERREREERERVDRERIQERKVRESTTTLSFPTKPVPAFTGGSVDKTQATIAAASAAAAAALALVNSPASPPKKPIIDAYNILTPSYTLDELRKFKMKGVDRSQREAYLTQEDFQAAFGMTRDSFYALPKWKRQDSKAKLGIF